MSRLASIGDQNFAVHAAWFHRHTAGMIVHEGYDFVLADSGLSCETFNVVCCARFASEAQALSGIASALHHFATVNRPFSWWSSPADQPVTLPVLFQRLGLVAAEAEVAMSLELPGLRNHLTLPAELRIKRVLTVEQLHDFANVTANSWTPPDLAVLAFYERVASTALQDHCPIRLFVGYVDDTPVATAECTITPDAVGVYNVATLAAYRHRGYGTAMVVSPLIQAKAEGHTRAVLQASAAGIGLYKQIGFGTYGQITEYKPQST